MKKYVLLLDMGALRCYDNCTNTANTVNAVRKRGRAMLSRTDETAGGKEARRESIGFSRIKILNIS